MIMQISTDNKDKKKMMPGVSMHGLSEVIRCVYMKVMISG